MRKSGTMHRRRTLGALVVAVAAAGVLPVAALPAAAAPATGTIELTGWYDTNRNGVRDTGEDPVGAFSDYTEASNSTGGYTPNADHRTITVPPGTYQVRLFEYATTTPAVTVTVAAGGRATATFGLISYTASGTVWRDTNLDGVRQSGEPPVSGVLLRVRDGRAVSDKNGHYTMGHLGRFGEAMWVPETENGKHLVTPHDQHPGSLAFPGSPELTADSPTDSDFSYPFLASATAQTGVGGQDLTGVDLGFAPAPYNQSVRIRADRDISKLHVGDEFIAVLTVRGVSGHTARREIDVYSDAGEAPPTGLSVVRADGAGWPAEIGQHNKLVTVRPTAALPIGATHTIRVRLRVDSVPQQNADSFVGAVLNGADSNGFDEQRLHPKIVR